MSAAVRGLAGIAVRAGLRVGDGEGGVAGLINDAPIVAGQDGAKGEGQVGIAAVGVVQFHHAAVGEAGGGALGQDALRELGAVQTGDG